MKKGILVTVVILFASLSVVQAQEGELHGTIDVTYLSKYVWRGFDIYGDKSAIQPSIDLDLYGTGFGVNIMGHMANSSEHVNGERWDYTLYYSNSLFEGESYATNYRLCWINYNYPDHPSKGIDEVGSQNASLQELHAMLSWPNICPAGFIPSYILVKLWPSESGSFSGSNSPLGGTASGFAHIFMLDYPMTIQGIMPDTAEQVLHLHTEVIYNDGVGPAGQNVDQDWSNAVFGISTSFDLGSNMMFTPAIYHQVTMDKSVNDDKDETWVSAGLTYKF